MTGDVIQFGLTAFVTLIVVVDPFGIAPIFIALTEGRSKEERSAVLARALTIAFFVTLFFMIAGRATLSYLGVSMHAFAISGGILLFATSLPMLIGHRGGLQSPEQSEGEPDQDVAVFPLAIPLLSGPGTIATTLLLTSQAEGSMARSAVLILAIAAVFLVSRAILFAGEKIMARMGESGVHIATRVLGIVLAALAVQFVLNGLTGYYHDLVAGQAG